jgi:hypothetical protein
MTTKVLVWASGDRYTASNTVYERTHPSGMVERITIEEVRILKPRLHKFRVGEFGPLVVSMNTILYNRRTKKPVKPRHKYWTVSQSGFGGKGTKGDVLGGFWTGSLVTHYDKKIVAGQVGDLIANGFARIS